MSGIELLKDDRFLMVAESRWEGMCDAHRDIVKVPSAMWVWLAELAGLSPDEGPGDLRSRALWSSLVALGYCYRDSFERLGGYRCL